MTMEQSVQCPYCHDIWEVDLDSDYVFDEHDTDDTGMRDLVCENCAHLHLG
jgi:hypothetical protein